VGDRTLADGERGGNQQCKWHTTGEPRTGIVSVASRVHMVVTEDER